jgi:hypothetical protein
MATSGNPSQIREEWFGKANAYTPKKGTEYGWVLDYAKLRLGWATESIHRVDSKALELVKVILISFAGFWPAIKLLSPADPKVHPSQCFLVLVGCAYLSLFISGLFALWAYLPKKRMWLVAEDMALACADRFDRKDEAIAKFSQAISATIESELETAAKYGRKTRISIGFLLLALFS